MKWRHRQSTGSFRRATRTTSWATSRALDARTNATQTAKFTYDDRGLLTSEEHPELGVTGQGKTEYFDYDASGRFRRELTGTENGEFDLPYGSRRQSPW